MDGLTDSIINGVNAATSFLPDSPFENAIDSMRSTVGSELLGYINYFLPVSEFMSVLSAWVAAILVYYVISLVLRWAKAIS